MIRQSCPNCGTSHDIKVYVSGQRLLCRCGIHFEVRRTDVSMVGGRSAISRPTPMELPPLAAPPPDSEAPVGAETVAQRPSEERPGPPIASDVPAAPIPLATPANAAVETPPEDQTFISSASTRLSLPGYELIEVLGRGGMGEVWRAQQKSLGRTVAVKLLPPKLAADKEFVTRFDKEATALATLSHPNIIQIIDRGVATENYFFVMEYVAGRSLRELMNSGGMTTADALKIVAQICRAIEHAHDQRIIHRDLKPENILIDDRGHVKVADFGLAGIRGTDGTDPKHQLTATSVAMGTVNYMAPEQRRDAKHVDGRADIYSVGVLLYELLTGELPIGRFRMPSERVAGLDTRLDHIVTKCLESEVDARYQSAKELLADLEAVIGSGTSTGSVASVPAKRDPDVTQRERPAPAASSVIHHGWRGVRGALMVIGGLSVLAFLAQRGVFGKVGAEDGKPTNVITNVLDALDSKKKPEERYPPNTEGDLFVSATERETARGLTELTLGFGPGTEEINAHAGFWRIGDRALKVTQAGSQTDGQKLVPRAYIAHRYFSSDDFTAEAEVTFRQLDKEFTREPDAQQFAELAFRIKDTQVSMFAIPGGSMRLGWRFYTPDGVEQVGNSARDIENMVADEMPVPPAGKPFKMRLTLRKKKNGVEVECFLNEQRFARKFLIGLEGRTGKVAVGCRNLNCEFRDLIATGKPQSRPKQITRSAVE